MRLDRKFKVNKYITLKLEDDKTNIYVEDEIFLQCKYLLLTIQASEIQSLNEIKSIDEAAEVLDKSHEDFGSSKARIPPEIEFWGHCSNFQVWHENNYDPRLLHSSLSFSLLKKLTDAGDKRARRVFREEILRRLGTGSNNMIISLLENSYLDYFSKDELLFIYEENLPTFKSSKLLLPFLRAFSSQGFPNICKYYNSIVRELMLTRNFNEKGKIFSKHSGILTKKDLIYIFDALKSTKPSNFEEGARFEVLDRIMYILQEQYGVDFGILDMIEILLREDEQDTISNILLNSQYPYVKLSFQADAVRRRFWKGVLYYEFFEGNVMSLELLCDYSNEVEFYENLRVIEHLNKLRHLNLLFFCQYRYELIEDILLKTNIEIIKLYEFLNASQNPNLLIIRG